MRQFVFTASLLVAALPSFAADNSGRIDFSGRVVQSACTLAAESKQISVQLGDVHTSALKSSYDHTAERKSFSIKLTDCAVVQGSAVLATLSLVDANPNDTGMLGITEDGGNAARGVGIRVWNKEGEQELKFAQSTPVVVKPNFGNGISSSAYEFNFQSAIAAHQIQDVTPGTVNGQMTFQIEYK